MTNSIKPGNFIVGYHNGVHVVTHIRDTYDKSDWECRSSKANPGDPIPPESIRIHYRKVMDGEFKKPHARRKGDSWAYYCTLVDTTWVDNLEKEYAEKIARLRKLVAGQWETANSISIN
jgi:hypothetical protein